MPDTTQPAPTPTTGPLASRYVDVAAIAWEKTRFAGVEWKILMEDKERGLLTALMRWAPGATTASPSCWPTAPRWPPATWPVPRAPPARR